MSITSRLVLFSSICIGAIIAALTMYTHVYIKEKFEQELYAEMELVANLFDARTQARKRGIEEIVENTVLLTESFGEQNMRLGTHLPKIVKNNKEQIFGMCWATNNPVNPSANYAYWCEDKVCLTDFYVDKQLDYQQQEWFEKPVQLKTGLWTSYYREALADNTLMATYSYPVWNKDSMLIGILTGDLSLDWLNEDLNKLAKENYHQLVLLTDKTTGEILLSPDEINWPIDLKQLPLSENAKGIYAVQWEGETYYILTRTDDRQNWNINVIFSQQEVQQHMKQLSTVIIYLTIIGIVLSIVALLLIGKSITQPLRKLSFFTKVIGKGEFSAKVPYLHRKDEVGQLAHAFNHLQVDLQKYVEDIKEHEAVQQQINSELSIGRNIQQELLPDPLLLDTVKFKLELQGILQPAKEVGGDLYDYFLIDNRYLVFYIADIAGKGIPAAMYMTGIRSFIRAKLTMPEADPSQTLYELNNALVARNSQCMFVTLVMGYLDINEGQLQMIYAGHDAALLLNDNRLFSLEPEQRAMALGVLENIPYRSVTYQLKEDTVLFLYTDGLTDARNEQEEVFGMERLKTNLNQINKQIGNPEYLLKEVNTFIGKAQPFDDITYLVLHYKKK